jgi:large subunit ribosomal protein L9
VKVILSEDIPSLGKIGDVVQVADGYGRNFLIPQGKALPATSQSVKKFEHQKQVLKQKVEKEKKEAEKLAKKLEGVSCTITMDAGEGDKLFGAVTSMDIEAALKNEDITVDRKKILLEEPIKSLGIYTVPIKLHPGITANLKVWVVKA